MKPEKTTLDWKIEERRIDLAGEKADEVLATFGHGLPVDPRAIAASEGRRLVLCGENFGDAFDGQIEYHASKDKFLAFYNTKYDRVAGTHHPRTRFSIAHELGHYYLDEHRQHLVRGGESHRSRGEFATDRIREREADSFAATLLLPTKAVTTLVNAQPFELSVVENVARRFDVSLVSAAIRAVKLCHFPAAVAGVRPGSRPWFVASRAFREAGCTRLSSERMPSSASRRMFARFERGAADRSSENVLISEWFHTGHRTNLDDVCVTEQYVPLGSMDTLLVLLSGDERDLFGD